MHVVRMRNYDGQGEKEEKNKEIDCTYLYICVRVWGRDAKTSGYMFSGACRTKRACMRDHPYI